MVKPNEIMEPGQRYPVYLNPSKKPKYVVVINGRVKALNNRAATSWNRPSLHLLSNVDSVKESSLGPHSFFGHLVLIEKPEDFKGFVGELFTENLNYAPLVVKEYGETPRYGKSGQVPFGRFNPRNSCPSLILLFTHGRDCEGLFRRVSGGEPSEKFQKVGSDKGLIVLKNLSTGDFISLNPNEIEAVVPWSFCVKVYNSFVSLSLITPDDSINEGDFVVFSTGGALGPQLGRVVQLNTADPSAIPIDGNFKVL